MSQAQLDQIEIEALKTIRTLYAMGIVLNSNDWYAPSVITIHGVKYKVVGNVATNGEFSYYFEGGANKFRIYGRH